jgi:hypothetical protein
MAIDPLLNILAERVLIACDSAYFTSIDCISPYEMDTFVSFRIRKAE